MCREWRERGVFEATEQRVCDQARAIRKNGWLTDLELEEIRRNIRDKNELDEIEHEENSENYNDTEDPVAEERITTTADDPENNIEKEHYTVLIHEEATEEEKKILNRLLQVMRDQKTWLCVRL